MGQNVELVAGDGHRLAAYRADPATAGKAGAGMGVVVLQEIFGVNAHIRSVVDRLAGEGFTAIAPALFDRVAPGYEAGYTDADIAHARGFMAGFDWDAALLDVDAAAAHLRGLGLKVGVVGFCLGGSVAFLAATRLAGLSAAVGYYGGKIAEVKAEVPACPTLLHYAREDHTIPLSDVEAVRAVRPDVALHVYDGGHGFNCDARASYHPQSAATAWGRTIAHLRAAI